MKKQHYILVAGQVIFELADETHGIMLNALVTGDTKDVTAARLGKAQQALQINFFQKMNDPNAQVRDVVIMSITHLGYMTDADFKKAPEGMELQEKINEAFPPEEVTEQQVN